MHDILYQKKKQNATEKTSDVFALGSDDENAEIETGDEMQMEIETDDEGDGDHEGAWDFVQQVPTEQLLSIYNDPVKKARKICSHFKRSPKQNDSLQDYVKKDKEIIEKFKGKFSIEKQGLQVKLDVSTRWNSIHSMIKRFLQLRTPIHKTLIDFKKQAMFPTDTEMSILEELVEALEIVEVGTRMLCERKTTLADADKIFEFVLKKLKESNGTISSLLREKIIVRINQRRLPKLSTLQAYLENPKFIEEMEGYNNALEYATLEEIVETAQNLYQRLYPASTKTTEFL